MGNCQFKEISEKVSPEEDIEDCFSSEDSPSPPPSEKHLTVHSLESVVRDLHPGQYPRLAPGGIAFQIGGRPGRIPDRIVKRLRRKEVDKTKIECPHNLQMTRSDRKLLARHIREEALEDRRQRACRTHLHADAFRRRLVLAAEEEVQPRPPMDSATSARMRQLETVKARAAERRAKAREINARIKNTEEALRRAHT